MILVADASALIALAGLISEVAQLLKQIAASPVFMGAELLLTVLDLAGE